jgi:hypothetical protein
MTQMPEMFSSSNGAQPDREEGFVFYDSEPPLTVGLGLQLSARS